MTLTFREIVNIQLTQPQWIELDKTVKDQLINIFNIPRTEPTKTDQRFVPGQGVRTVVLSDGHSHKDLAVITVEKMQEYLGNYNLTDFYALFGEVLNRLAVKEKTTVEDQAKKVETENLANWLMVLTAMRNDAKKFNLVEQLNTLVEEVFKHEIPTIQKTTVKGSKARK